MSKLKAGDAAPFFEGINQNGEKISLNDFKEKKLILYFYPKDDTPGCTAESCNLSDNYEFWLNNGFDVLGVSPDNQKSHQKFINKYGLKFNLIADTEKDILKLYDVWGEKSMYGRKYMGVIRTTFLIDENGIITEVFEKVDKNEHTGQIKESLKL